MTFAVDMLEWQVVLPVGNATLTLHFTGGSYTGYARRPATYRTESPVIAGIIRNSCYFRNGKIYELKSKTHR